MTLWLVSMAIFVASSLLGSLNYIVTVINLRTKGMSMTRLAFDHLGIFCNSYYWCGIIPSIIISGLITDYGS